MTERSGAEILMDSLVAQGVEPNRIEAKGYGEFCRPPHIRRRGHGLGFGSNVPGDVSVDNPTILEAGMFFVIHPNQYLPETGYLLCGEPVLITEAAPELLSENPAALSEIPI